MLKRSIYLGFSLVATTGILSYLFTKVSVGDLLQLLREIDRGLLACFLILSLAMSFFRTWRYSLILRHSGYSPKLSSLFLTVLVRNFFSDILPARIGTTVYIYLANSRLGVPLSVATSSFAISFLFDIIAIVPMILLAVWLVGATTILSSSVLVTGTIALAAIAVTLLSFLPKILTLMERTPLPKRIKEVMHQTASELRRYPSIYGEVLFLSVLVRVCKYASLWAFLFALLRPLGFETLAVPEVFLGICASELSASLPISGIGGFGLYEGTWALTFTLLGFQQEIAELTAVSHHLFTQVYGYAIGAFALALLLHPFFEIRTSQMDHKLEEVKIYWRSTAMAGLLALLCFGVFQIFKVFEANASPTFADAATSSEQTDREWLAQELPGEIVFDSNHSGTFGIYASTTEGKSIRTIYDSKFEEQYPDPSPNGEHIVFARSRSTSRLAPSEIWIIDRDGSNPRKIIGKGTFPTFSNDGKFIYFERKRKQVMRVNTDGSELKQVFPIPNIKFGNYQVVKPRVSFDQESVAFTSDKNGRWHAWQASLKSGKASLISDGCEPTWYEGNKDIAFIKNEHAKGGSGVFYFNQTLKEASALYDTDGKRGHEYFPSLAYKNRFLLFGASAPEEHSHTEANYQLFARDLEKGKTVRITFNAATNRWPKWLSPVL